MARTKRTSYSEPPSKEIVFEPETESYVESPTAICFIWREDPESRIQVVVEDLVQKEHILSLKEEVVASEKQYYVVAWPPLNPQDVFNTWKLEVIPCQKNYLFTC